MNAHQKPLPFLSMTALALTICSAMWGAPQGTAAKDGAARPEAAKIDGRWSAVIGGKTYALDLRLAEGDLTGTVRLPNGKTVDVTDGICVTDEFSFTTVEDDVEWEWSGTVDESGLRGERLRLDNEQTVPFTAKRGQT